MLPTGVRNRISAIAAGKKMPATKIEAGLLLPRIWYALQIYNIFKQSQQQHENKFIKMQLYTLIYENSYGNAATKIYRYSLVASR